MSKIHAAREALDRRVFGSHGLRGQREIMPLADAYGAARELKGHVDACETGGWICS